MPRSESIEFQGVTFRRYPDAKQRADRVYYRPHIADRRNGVGDLHVEIWKAAHGDVPAGWHVHHRDGNPLNNAVDNLECLTVAEHVGAHMDDERRERSRRHAEVIRPLAAAWHSSPEGRAWHVEHGRLAWAERESVTHVCDQCGVEFQSITRRDSDRFCSNNCKSAWRRASGVDDEWRDCTICGTAFRVNKYSRQACCSRPCGSESRRRKLAGS